MHTSFAHGRLTRFCLLSLLMVATLAGVEVHVAPTGNDSAGGTNAAPLRTVQAGINRVVAGDTVVVHAGVYRERLTFPRNGTASSPIVVSGQPGAAIDGGDYFTGWERVTTLPGNVWRLAGSPYGRTIEMNMTWNEKYIAGIREELMDTTGLDTLSLGPQGWDAYDGTLYRSWNGIQALFGRLNGYTYIGFGDSAINPNQQILAFAPEKTGGATILLDGRSWITVRGLTVYNGKFQVYLHGANDCVVEDNILRGGQNTVLVDGGSARTRIRRNDLTLNYVHDLDPSNSRHWFIWAVFKQQSYWDRVAIELENIGADNEIYDNNIHQHWDGIQNVGSALRLKVHDNTIDHLADDGLEPVGDQADAEWFDNDVSRCNILYRHKGMRSTDTMYVYGNRFYTESAAAWFPQGPEALGIYFFTGTAGKTYFYHNSFATKQGIATGSTSPATGLPNTWMVNNIVSVDRFWGGAGGFPTLPKFDYNYVGSDLASRLSWWGTNGVMAKPGKLWSTTTTPDFRLTATSPARGIGIDLSQPWTMDGVTHPALPGMSPGYFSGTRPDVGAYQYQASGPTNQAPVVSAGADRTITLPASVSLLGSATDDGLPASSVLTYAWSKVSGSGTVTFGSATSASTTAAFSIAGTYVLRLAVGDSALTGSDTVTITINLAPPTNAAPIVDAGVNQAITLPATASLSGSATDDALPTGSSLAFAWSKVSGPGIVAFGSATSASSTAAFSVAGTYVLRLTVGDSALTGSDTLTVTVAADTTAPGTPAAPITSNATSATPTLSGTTEFYATITIFDDGVLIGSVTADGTGAWSWTVSPALVSGVHHLTVIATDAAHNASAASSATVVTVSASSGSGAASGSGNSGSSGGGCGLGVGVGVFGVLVWAAGMLVLQRRIG